MLTANYAQDGDGVPTAGWKNGYDGIIRAYGAIFRNCDVRGTLHADDIIYGTLNAARLPPGMPSGIAPNPGYGQGTSPNFYITAPSNAPSGFTVLYSIGGGATMSHALNPGGSFLVSTGGANVIITVQGTATGMSPSSVDQQSWNSLFL
jgi:hypothetical protein